MVTWYERSMVRAAHGTNSQWYEKSSDHWMHAHACIHWSIGATTEATQLSISAALACSSRPICARRSRLASGYRLPLQRVTTRSRAELTTSQRNQVRSPCHRMHGSRMKLVSRACTPARAAGIYTCTSYKPERIRPADLLNVSSVVCLLMDLHRVMNADLNALREAITKATEAASNARRIYTIASEEVMRPEAFYYLYACLCTVIVKEIVISTLPYIYIFIRIKKCR